MAEGFNQMELEFVDMMNGDTEVVPHELDHHLAESGGPPPSHKILSRDSDAMTIPSLPAEDEFSNAPSMSDDRAASIPAPASATQSRNDSRSFFGNAFSNVASAMWGSGHMYTHEDDEPLALPMSTTHSRVEHHEDQTARDTDPFKQHFIDLDRDNSGRIRADDMNNRMHEEHIRDVFRFVGLDISDGLQVLTKLEASSSSGLIDIDEFAQGCLRLKTTKGKINLDAPPDDVLDAEVTRERGMSTFTGGPPASHLAQKHELYTGQDPTPDSLSKQDFTRQHTTSDDFITRFGPDEIAGVVDEVIGSNTIKAAADAAETDRQQDKDAAAEGRQELEPPLPPPETKPPENDSDNEGDQTLNTSGVTEADMPQLIPYEEEKRDAEATPDHVTMDVRPAQENEEEQEETQAAIDESQGCFGRCKGRSKGLLSKAAKKSRGKQRHNDLNKGDADRIQEQEQEELQDLEQRGFQFCVAWLVHSAGLARCPSFCILFGILALAGIIAGGMVAKPIAIETDFGTFLKTDVNTSAMRDAFLFALKHRQEGSRRLTLTSDEGEVEHLWEEEEEEPQEGRKLQGNRLYKHQDIFFAYELPEGSELAEDEFGFLDPGILAQVVEFEKEMRATESWERLCNMTEDSDRALCLYGVSMANYVHPTPVIPGFGIVPSMLTYDGKGKEGVPPQVSAVLLQDHGVRNIVLPTDWEAGQSVRVIRSAFRFKWFCCYSTQSSSEQRVVLEEFRKIWDEFIVDTVFPAIQAQVKHMKSGKGDKVQIAMWFEGSGISNKEVMQTLTSDLYLACGSMVFVLIYLLIHTSSFLLSLAGLLTIMSAIPCAYVFFAVLTGSNQMSIASFLSFFLVIGLGSDVVFVYTDFWKESKDKGDGQERKNIGSRMTWTLLHAGKASLATTATTALSFFANLASVLKPLREFGFFMGLCVMIVWVLLTCIYVPLCVVDECYFSGCRVDIKSYLTQTCGRCMGPLRRKADEINAVRFELARHRSNDRDGSNADAIKDAESRLRKLQASDSVDKYVKKLKKCPILIFLIPALICIGFVVWALLRIKVDSGVPSIFPDNHNQKRGKEVLALFEDPAQAFDAMYMPRQAEISVCTDEMFAQMGPGYKPGRWAYLCNILWCEAHPDVPKSEDGVCNCWRKEVEGTCSVPRATVSSKIFATREVDNEETTGEIADYFDSIEGISLPQAERSKAMRREGNLAPVVTEEWERGVKEVRTVTEVYATVERTDTETSSCGFQDMCFCGSYSCKMLGDEWSKVETPLMLPKFNISEAGEDSPTSRRASAVELVPTEKYDWMDELLLPAGGAYVSKRRLADSREAAERRWLQSSTQVVDVLPPSEWTVTPANRALVDIVFGITVVGGSTLLGNANLENAWQFSEMHQVSQPWAQRNMYAFCTQMPRELRVVERRCWIEDFRGYLLNYGKRFPIVASEFKREIIPFAESWLTGLHSTKEFLWIRNNEVKASFMGFLVDFHKYATSGDAIEYKKLWDAYVDRFNLDASIYAKGAWHTSYLWVRAEAQAALISSTIWTVAIVITLAMVGMLAFTRDITLSVLVVVATLGVICGLTWFIVVAMGWAVGAIEVIALIVFIGYAVTYSLHISHRYGCLAEKDLPVELRTEDLLVSQEIRFARTAFALNSIGGAALGSAATTAGCSIFLVFCTLTIFQKLGGVVLAVTLMSIFAALVPLPAVLLTIGPINPGGCLRLCLEPSKVAGEWRSWSNRRAQELREREKEREQQKLALQAAKDREKTEAEKEKLRKQEEEQRKKQEAEAARKREQEEKARSQAAAAAQVKDLASGTSSSSASRPAGATAVPKPKAKAGATSQSKSLPGTAAAPKSATPGSEALRPKAKPKPKASASDAGIGGARTPATLESGSRSRAGSASSSGSTGTSGQKPFQSSSSIHSDFEYDTGDKETVLKPAKASSGRYF
eukprot:TRINITY_DN60799_c0_g1_i1.p1 TRINITY_DN60799_c0_g1~~TRINITY_DN60799_c0_g1_i1.p1  ORF type:complete len:1951 (-),score=403.43 TRINITY_DN60799_c0_g1_i1:35-5824(-)